MKEDFTIQARNEIAARFKKIREKRNLSLRQLEALTGIGHSWLGKLENGKVNFQIDSLVKLMEALQIQPKELFSFKLDYKED